MSRHEESMLGVRSDVRTSPAHVLAPLRRAAFPRVPVTLRAAALYAAATALLYRHVLGGMSTTLLDTRDELLYLWWWRWIPHAILHGHNPLITTAMNYPVGGNGMWNTTVPLLAVLMSPVTLVAGPVFATNLALVLGPFVSALVAYLVIRRYTRGAPAAVAGGLAYGFSPFFIGHGSGHLSLMWGFFPPLLVYFLDEVVVRQRRNPLALGALLGATCAAQLLVSNELLLLGAVVAVVAVVVLTVNARGRVRDRLPFLLRSTATAAAVALVLSAGPLWVTAFGPHRPRGVVQPAGIYVSNLLGFVVPTAQQWLSPGALTAVSGPFANEPTAYIGIPLLLVLVAVTIVHWRRPLVRVVSMTGLATAVLSMGPWLNVGGTRYKSIPLPWALLQRRPLFENALPGRLSLYVAVCIAVLVAVALDGFERASARGRIVRWIVTALAFVPLVPVAFPAIPLPRTPALFTTAASSRIPKDAVVVIQPYAFSRDVTAMLWQAQAGMRFRMPGGLVATDLVTVNGYWDFGPAPSSLRDVCIGLQNGVVPPLDTGLRRRLLADLFRLHARAVVVGPTYFEEQSVVFFARLLGLQPDRMAGVWYFDLDKIETTLRTAEQAGAGAAGGPADGFDALRGTR